MVWLKLWLGAVPNAKLYMNIPQVDVEINTDVIKIEWGAMDGSDSIWGLCSQNGKTYHINYIN